MSLTLLIVLIIAIVLGDLVAAALILPKMLGSRQETRLPIVAFALLSGTIITIGALIYVYTQMQ